MRREGNCAIIIHGPRLYKHTVVAIYMIMDQYLNTRKIMKLPRKNKTRPDKLTREVCIFLKYELDHQFSLNEFMSYFNVSEFTLNRDLAELSSVVGFGMCGFDGDLFCYCEEGPMHIPAISSKSKNKDDHMKRLSRIYDMYYDYYDSFLLYMNKNTDKIYYSDHDSDAEDDSCKELQPKLWYSKNTTSAEKRQIQRDYKVLTTAAEMMRNYYDYTVDGRSISV